ncbi:P-loop containing nucleoside triphosphate hydrolase protein [Chiua virens]|nr:P-loop containing nucleoside triphosphate hydrolase protein [Chiua virens]
MTLIKYVRSQIGSAVSLSTKSATNVGAEQTLSLGAKTSVTSPQPLTTDRFPENRDPTLENPLQQLVMGRISWHSTMEQVCILPITWMDQPYLGTTITAIKTKSATCKCVCLLPDGKWLAPDTLHELSCDATLLGAVDTAFLAAQLKPSGRQPTAINSLPIRSLTNTEPINLPMPSSDEALNIVLFGETGVGKSSVINLLAGEVVAKVSPDIKDRTLQSTKYTLPLEGGAQVRIWDTVGLEEPTMGVSGYLSAIEKAHSLIRELGDAGGVDLLLFCMRGCRITATTQGNYRLFHEVLCNREVPIALVVTHLERETKMEDWWVRNEGYIRTYGIHSVGHACITGVEEDDKYEQSRDTLRDLLFSQLDTRPRFAMQPESWLAKLLAGLGSFLKNKNPPRERMIRTLVKRCNMDGETARRLSTLLTC